MLLEQHGEIISGRATHVTRTCQGALDDLDVADGRAHGDSVFFSLGSCRYRGLLSSDSRIIHGLTDCNVPVNAEAVVLTGTWSATRIEPSPRSPGARESVSRRLHPNRGAGTQKA